jgi:hypothetical protein
LLAAAHLSFHLEAIKGSGNGKPNKLDYSSLNSFRPISLVSNLAKIFEKVVLGRLLWFANAHEWLNDCQHGFRENRSTDSAAHSFISFIESAFSDKKVAAAAFLDIKSAFDSAWHPAIIAAFSSRGCPTYLVNIISSFLKNRSVVLSIGDVTSVHPMSLGCPQGGVLSPFLWNVLIDDILKLSFPHFPVKMAGFADDLSIATTHKDPFVATKNLQTACDHIGAWLESRKLQFNADKTVVKIFARKCSPGSSEPLVLSIKGVQISPSLDASFLGLTLDPSLKWHRHLQGKIVSAKRAMFAANSCIRQTFCSDGHRLRFLYSTVV